MQQFLEEMFLTLSKMAHDKIHKYIHRELEELTKLELLEKLDIDLFNDFRNHQSNLEGQKTEFGGAIRLRMQMKKIARDIKNKVRLKTENENGLLKMKSQTMDSMVVDYVAKLIEKARERNLLATQQKNIHSMKSLLQSHFQQKLATPASEKESSEEEREKKDQPLTFILMDNKE